MGKELVKISIIAAFSNNRVIGRDGDMPWRLSGDLKRFKEVTMDKPVIMGRKTFDSIGKPLPGRTNIVISRRETLPYMDGVLVVDSYEGAVELAKQKAWDKGVGEAFVIGGGQIYKQAIETADYIYATHVHANIEGDTHFPVILDSLWEPFVSRPGPAVDEKNSHETTFTTYKRR